MTPPLTRASATPEMPSSQDLTGGLPQSTPLLTLDGLLPVDYLEIGDRIVTRNSGAARLTGHRTEERRRHAVRISADALGTARPEIPLILPVDQRILLRGPQAMALSGQPQTMVPVGHLVDDRCIHDIGEIELTLHFLTFERAQIVYAAGLELLSAMPVAQGLRPAA